MWDGANKKWEKASDLEAISVGSKRIAYTGTTPKGVNADKLGEYARKQGDFQKCEHGVEPSPTPSHAPSPPRRLRC